MGKQCIRYFPLGLLQLFLTLNALAFELPNRKSCDLLKSEFLDFSKSAKVHTDSFMVSKGNNTLFEVYDGSYTSESRHALWSASKTVAMLMAGTTVQKGLLKLDDPIDRYISYEARKKALLNPFPQGDVKDEARDRVRDEALYSQLTVRHLINQNSSLQWLEDYGDNIQNSSIAEMLYGKDYVNMAGYVLSLPFTESGPGNTWNYSTGDATLLTHVLAVANRGNPQFPWTNLFDRLDISGAVVERDGLGNYLGGSHVFLKTKDMLKIGQLMLFDGVWNGVQVLPSDWMKFARAVSPGEIKGGFSDEFIEKTGVYGGGLWLNESIRGLKPTLPHSSPKIFMAAGHFGQYIIVFPDENLVAVRTGHDADFWSNMDLFVNRVSGCFGDSIDSPLPPLILENEVQPSLPISQELYAMRSGLIAKMIAKEFCSCVYVTGLSLSECQDRSSLPSSVFSLFKMKQKSGSKFEVKPDFLDYLTMIAVSPKAKAFIDPMHPEEGCRLY